MRSNDVPFKFTGTVYAVTIDRNPRDSSSAAASKKAQKQAALQHALRE